MKALVLGATGAIGKDLVEQLLKDDTFDRENGYKIRPICPYAEKVLDRDSSFSDVIA